ncbi:MAG: hypothetical protein WKH64_19465, partial [Chloroflexia bacterium]
TVEMPDALVEHQVEHDVEAMSREYAGAGISPERYIALLEQLSPTFRVQMRVAVRRRLARTLVLEEIGKAENIEVTDEDVDVVRRRIRRRVGPEAREEAEHVTQQESWITELKAQLYTRKLVNRLVEIATGSPLDTETDEDEDDEAELEAANATSDDEAELEADTAIADETSDPAAGIDAAEAADDEEAALVEPPASATVSDDTQPASDGEPETESPEVGAPVTETDQPQSEERR